MNIDINKEENKGFEETKTLIDQMDSEDLDIVYEALKNSLEFDDEELYV